LRILAYRYYGEDSEDTLNSLIELNDVADITFVEGEVEILSA